MGFLPKPEDGEGERTITCVFANAPRAARKLEACALVAEPKLVDAKTSNNGGDQNVSDMRYLALKRYLAKQFHPDYAPGHGIEKIVRNEIFKEIWSEIDRLDHQEVSATCSVKVQ